MNREAELPLQVICGSSSKAVDTEAEVWQEAMM